MRRCGALLSLFVLCAWAASPALGDARRDESVGDEIVQTVSQPATRGFDPAAAEQEQARLFRWLKSEQVPLKSAGVRIELTPQDRADIGAEPCTDCALREAETRRLRVGVVKPVLPALRVNDLTVTELSAKGGSFARGGLRKLDDGFVWTLAVESPDATALRVHLTDFRLPAGAALYLYNSIGEAFGPYTGAGPDGDGEFWTHTVAGERAFLQLRYEGTGRRQFDGLGFEVADVAHLGPRFLLPQYGAGAGAEKSFCSFNASCVENANCSNLPGAIQTARDGIAHIQFVSGAFLYICSGGLLADTDASTEVPLFLTANHCISRGKEAKSMEAYWQFETNCNGSCTLGGSVPRTRGASIVASNRTGDYTLMELGQSPPAGSVFIGWTNQPVAFSAGTALHRISHPMGAPQAYSTHAVDTSAGTCTSWPRGSWIYSEDTYGATEGGSSGSPVLNANGQVVGQLSGACGYNPSDPCDTASNSTVDGALASYFTEVAQWLDPTPGDPGGGDCGNGVCNAGEDCTSCSSDCAGQTGGKPSNRYCCGNGVAESAEGNGSICDDNY